MWTCINNHFIDDSLAFCSKCGAARLAVCEKCGASLILGDPFCGSCGQAIVRDHTSRVLQPPTEVHVAPPAFLTSSPPASEDVSAQKHGSKAAGGAILLMLILLGLYGFGEYAAQSNTFYKFIVDNAGGVDAIVARFGAGGCVLMNEAGADSLLRSLGCSSPIKAGYNVLTILLCLSGGGFFVFRIKGD